MIPVGTVHPDRDQSRAASYPYGTHPDVKADDLLRDPEFRDLTAKGYTCRQIHKRCKHAAKFSDTTVYRRWCILRAEFGMPRATTSYRPSIDESATAPPLPEEPPQEPTPQEYLDRERQRIEAAREKRDQSKALKAALDELRERDEIITTYAALEEGYGPISISAPNMKVGVKGHEATAVMLWSDWHVEQVVDPKRVDGLNEFNPGIAEKSVAALARNVVKLLKKERADVTLNSAVIWLGGDFISGNIHDELLETAAMPPSDAIIFAENLIAGALDYVLEHGGLKRVVIPCSYGNHGRFTAKMRSATGAGNNLETIMYAHLARRYASDDRVSFVPAQGELTYVTVYDRPIRFTHGHLIRYQNGIMGLGVPLAKAVNRYDAQRRADMTAIGHYHQHIMPARNSWINGALIGIDEYAMHMGAQPEPPVQGFRLLDSRYGWTISAPVFVREVV